MRVIELYAGPGAGKSTTAAGLFNAMKLMGLKVELVTEFAEDLTYGQRLHELGNQLYVLAHQEARQARLQGQVDWVITDSPLLLSNVYVLHSRFDSEAFRETVREASRQYDRVPFFMNRSADYQTYGSGQTREEAMGLDEEIFEVAWNEFDMDLTSVTRSVNAPSTIIAHLFARGLL